MYGLRRVGREDRMAQFEAALETAEFETQDDLGYYEYGFDVFPRRGTKSK